MLAGCSSSSSLLSPRHRLRSETSSVAQFQGSCHFQLPSMNTQRLDLPCSSFSRKEANSRSQQPLESKPSSCSLNKQNIRLPPLTISGRQNVREDFWEEEKKKGKKSLKRFAEHSLTDESCVKRVKRTSTTQDSSDDEVSEGHHDEGLSFWFQSGVGGGQNSHFCSEEEERVCFAPSEVVSPPLPLSNNPWIDSVITEITDFGEKDVETSHRPERDVSGSSDSSESRRRQSSGLGLQQEISSGHEEVHNGSVNPYYHHQQQEQGTSQDFSGLEERQYLEHQGFELVSLLTACVEAIGSKNIPAINHFIAKLGGLASPRGNTISRLVAYYTEALALRVTRLWPHIFHITPPREFDRIDDDSGFGTALRVLNQVSPIPKFLHFTANETLLRAFEGKDRIHIIDFDIKQGLQWPSFFQSLASRANPPSHVRITGIGESKQDLNETGDRLAGFADALNLGFEFHPVVDRLEDVRLWMLHVKDKESVAVNCMLQLHKILYDTNGGALRDFLGLLRSTNPILIVIGEQEAEHNAPSFESRVANSLKYYSAIFDLIDSSLPMESPGRIKIEEMFAKEMRNIVACEGNGRVERHESFEKWKKLVEEGSFLRCKGIGEREFQQSRMLLRMYNNKYEVKMDEQSGAITLSWLDQPLYTVSAWEPVLDIAGGASSSSFPQPV
ncbi:LOW QUALITY PROTEIN: scarecrow-like protein 28 [Rutidosis leptorrhynchoides]|uniref:LOW QUALITY PROTEIN: scarecrow-like protein 28 n=1 Tax=Rutidosis leptorrhynchoides TaxID=125765 RepID=UPI003A9959A7